MGCIASGPCTFPALSSGKTRTQIESERYLRHWCPSEFAKCHATDGKTEFEWLAVSLIQGNDAQLEVGLMAVHGI